MLAINRYRKKEDSAKRFLCDALGEGLHTLHDFWCGGPPPAVLVEDFGSHPEIGQLFDVELVLPDPDEFVPLEQIASHVAHDRRIPASEKRLSSSPEEYAALKASIRRHGRCYEPVIKNRNGKIISGNERLRACKEARCASTQNNRHQR